MTQSCPKHLYPQWPIQLPKVIKIPFQPCSKMILLKIFESVKLSTVFLAGVTPYMCAVRVELWATSSTRSLFPALFRRNATVPETGRVFKLCRVNPLARRLEWGTICLSCKFSDNLSYKLRMSYHSDLKRVGFSWLAK